MRKERVRETVRKEGCAPSIDTGLDKHYHTDSIGHSSRSALPFLESPTWPLPTPTSIIRIPYHRKHPIRDRCLSTQVQYCHSQVNSSLWGNRDVLPIRTRQHYLLHQTRSGQETLFLLRFAIDFGLQTGLRRSMPIPRSLVP